MKKNKNRKNKKKAKKRKRRRTLENQVKTQASIIHQTLPRLLSFESQNEKEGAAERTSVSGKSSNREQTDKSAKSSKKKLKGNKKYIKRHSSQREKK